MNIKKVLPVLLVVLVALTSACAQTETSEEVVDVTLQNVGASAWKVTAADAEVAELDVNNPTLSLAVGTRYHFDLSGVNSQTHPFEFRGEDDARLLTQGGSPGTFEEDEAVAFEATDDGVTFTVTPELAAALTMYRCTVHAGMTGPVVTQTADE